MILAKTIKGWTIDALEGKNATHQMKKLTQDDLKKFRDRLYLPISDRDIERAYEETGAAPFFHPGEDVARDRVHARAPQAARRLAAEARACARSRSTLPGDEMYAELKQGSGKQSIATTMALVRLLKDLMKDPEIGKRIVPIAPGRVPHLRHGLDVPDREDLQPGRPELRVGRPQAAALLQGVGAGPDAARGHLRGRRDGLGDRRRLGVLHARRAHDPVLHLLLDVRVPAHRRLDLGDGRPAGPRLPDRRHRRPDDADRRGPAARRRPLAAARGDQPGGRALRPGVRLRGQPHRAGRPRADVRRGAPEDVIFYLTVYNEPVHAAGRAGGPRRRGPPQGHLPRRRRAARATGPRVQLLASGVGFPWISEAQRILAEDWGVAADTWSVTSWNELARDAVAAEEWNLLHPGESPRTPYVTDKLRGADGPGRRGVRLHARGAAADRAVGPGDYRVLGADGFGFADTRPAARRYFHDRRRVGRRADPRRRSPTRGEIERRRSRRPSPSTGSTTRPPSPA